MFDYFYNLYSNISSLAKTTFLLAVLGVFIVIRVDDPLVLLIYSLFSPIVIIININIRKRSKEMDSITGAYNLDYIIKLGDKFIRSGEKISVILLDINNFRQVNYNFGYLTGNYILYQLTNLIKNEVRRFNGVVGRIGGDEFIILLEDASLIMLNDCFSRLSTELQNQCFKCNSESQSIQLLFSIGMTSANLKSESTMHNLMMEASKNKITIMKTRYKADVNIITLDKLSPNLKVLVNALKEKDIYSYMHTQYVVLYSEKLAKRLNLSDQMIQDIHIGAWIHDLGKLFIPNDILKKPTSLSHKEYSIIKKHVIYGLNLVSTLGLSETSLNSLEYHHERYDGKGYPYRLSGEAIPIEARIMQIADAFSAMTIKRIYRNPLSHEDAITELQKNVSTQFDPYLVDEFVQILKN